MNKPENTKTDETETSERTSKKPYLVRVHDVLAGMSNAELIAEVIVEACSGDEARTHACADVGKGGWGEAHGYDGDVEKLHITVSTVNEISDELALNCSADEGSIQ